MTAVPVPPEEDERRWLRQADHTASRDFDKAIMTLAAGALGVSIAFVHDIAPDPVHVSWLGWGLGPVRREPRLNLDFVLDEPTRAAT